MLKTRLFNSIYQIYCSEHTNTILGVARHSLWLFRRAIKAFPVTVNLSKSQMVAMNHSGVYALVNSLNTYDYNNMTLIQIVLRQKIGSVFFDVGANVGPYTLVASEVYGSTVVAFEPHPATFEELRTNVDINRRSNVVLLRIAASDKNGYLILTDFPGARSSLNRVVDAPLHEKSSGGIAVISETLDKVCQDINAFPSVVKIDVEGHELRVLEGFRKSIPHVNVFLIEGGQREAVIGKLRGEGFEGPLYYHHTCNTLMPVPQRRSEDPLFVKRSFLDEMITCGCIKKTAGREEI